ncbi:peptidase S41 [Chitinophaga sp. Mgbs1]|uniref:Tricorn protease homolog n=1 Tax=Chitinophaga solisilvae TaxID=1233460 RepID=A0A3S1DNB8_9BACT|nr:peptidase S41 [Chitinophaga solisilvae]
MKTSFVIGACLLGQQAIAQIDAALFRYPDVSQTHIAFSYANDIWIVPKSGGNAIRLSSPPGTETFPKFSPDGNKLAFTANYDGNQDVYVMPVSGGVPFRLTSHGGSDRMVDWTPDGKQVFFASNRESSKDRYNQFYTIAETGGPATRMPLAYAEFGSFSPDGKSIAVTTHSQVFRTWKRYRGGMKGEIHLYNFDKQTSENFSAKSEAGDELPMWYKNYIYFLSDRGKEKRMNLWRYNTDNKSVEQITNYTDYDVHFPSLGPSEIVYEANGKLYLLSLATQQSSEVKVSVTTDVASLRPQQIKASKDIMYAAISPDGKRALVGARGEVFSLPAEDGFVKNLTQTSGVAERYPTWSPDGKQIAYWSDKSGEYELWLAEAGKENAARQVTHLGPGYRYRIFWSPDGKKIVFIDQDMKIYMLDIATGKATQMDKALHYEDGSLRGFFCNWSPDSRWATYSRDGENGHSITFLYDTRNNTRHQVTSGFYDVSGPVFDPEGKYLYVTTNRSFKPLYSDIDNTFIYANSTKLAAISLLKGTSPLLPEKNDAVEVKKDEAADAPAEKDKEKDKKKGAAPAKEKSSKDVDIDLDNMEARLTVLPVDNGNFGRLAAVKGKIIFVRYPNTGEGEGETTLKYFDIEKREEKDIIKNPGQYAVSTDGNKILVTGSRMGIIDVAAGQKIEKALRVDEMVMTVDPVQEWKQLFNDAWRIERDYFYDPGMHGVNWNQVKEKYARILDGARTREEVSFVLGEMIGEMNASHTYNSGGDLETTRSGNVGYLGIDWEAAGKFYKIKRIIRGAAWDDEARSPLDLPGSKIKDGDYILAVNGVPVTTVSEPFIFFQGLAGKAIELTYNSQPSFDGAKTAVIKPVASEYRLRHLAWIESNRKRVADATGGKVGYIFVPSTGLDGQDELIRQFNAQWHMDGLVIDERFNNGGQIPDRFIEMLNRKPLAYWATRSGTPTQWPGYAHFGPKVMLINGWSGSGGDAFPDYFRKTNLGPLIGTRTWGGLIGISGAPELIDGGEVTAPSFRMYNNDGTWFAEGHGVDPDIFVDENLGDMAKGTDPQLERAISEIKNSLQTKAYKAPVQPAYEKR